MATALTTPQAIAADQPENAVIATANRATTAAQQPSASELATVSRSGSTTSQLDVFGKVSAQVKGSPSSPGMIASTDGNSIVAQQVEETGRARNPAVVEGMVAGICAALGAEALGTACAIGAAEAAGIAAVASNSYGDGKCMALRAGLVPATVECS